MANTVVGSRPSKCTVTIGAVSLILVVSVVGYVLSNPDPIELLVLELSVGIGATLTLGYVGMRVGREGFADDEERTIIHWMLGGFFLLGSLATFIILHQTLEGATLLEPLYLLMISSTVGAIGGTIGGISTVRSHRISLELDHQPGPSSPKRRLELIDLLSHQYRRKITTFFIDRPSKTTTLNELVDYLVSDEADIDATMLETNVALSLQYVHLPRLEAGGLIEFDIETMTVEYVLDGTTEEEICLTILPLWSEQTTRVSDQE